jgi:hypothetical protein
MVLAGLCASAPLICSMAPAWSVNASATDSAVASTTPFILRITENFMGYPRARLLNDGNIFGPWYVVFDGVERAPGVRLRHGLLRLSPQIATRAGATNAALVISRQRFDDYALQLNATWTTRLTTRVGTANPWETGWLVWDYLDNDHFTYLILKPNGWEIGRRDPSQRGGQRFIEDGDLPITPIGATRSAMVQRVGGDTTVWVDGQPLTSFTIPAGEHRGAVGMYSEDAVVDWTSITVATAPA